MGRPLQELETKKGSLKEWLKVLFVWLVCGIYYLVFWHFLIQCIQSSSIPPPFSHPTPLILSLRIAALLTIVFAVFTIGRIWKQHRLSRLNLILITLALLLGIWQLIGLSLSIMMLFSPVK